MNASFFLLLIASLATAMPGDDARLEPVVLAAEAEAGSSPYIEISDLSPAPAKRIIHAHPKANPPLPQLTARRYDIAPLDAASPAQPLLVPPSANTVLQPVEPAATRPYIAPPAASGRCPSPPAATRAAYPTYPTYPTAVRFPTTTATQVTYMPVAQDGGLTIGRGSIGQPKLYVEGQPLRNFLRWLTP
jgi:hypothetical protein